MENIPRNTRICAQTKCIIHKRSRAREFANQKYLQGMVLPWIVWLIAFCYVPIYGIVIAFKDYSITGSLFGGDWVGLKHFKEFFSNPFFGNIMINTVAISLLKMLFCMPAPLLLALLINECRFTRAKKVFQSISYLPYFLSWVILSGMIFNIASSEGLINSMLLNLGLIKEPINFINDHFWALLVVSDMWKGIGWGAIIYMAALSAIDPSLYEAAIIDGAGRMRRIVSITLPLIVPTIIVILIFSLGGVLNSNFDQIYMLRNNQNYTIAEVIDTHVYTTGISEARYSYATAVGLFKSVIGFVLIYLSNVVAKIISKGEQGVF